MFDKKRQFQGSMVALVTPMKDCGAVDYDALNRLIEWHIDCGTHGLVIMGTTGESATVTMKEYFEVVAKSIEIAERRIPIIVGCSSPSTQQAVEMAKSLNRLEPEALLCCTPYYVKPPQEGLYRHFCQLAEASAAPIILYNVPGRTSCDLHNDTVVSLSGNANIVGIKDATGDLNRCLDLLERVNSDFCLLSGDDITAYDFIKSGGSGVISVTGNVFPREMAQWCQLLIKGETADSSGIFERLKPMHDALFIESNPIPVKWVMNQLNKIEQGIRLPLTQPSDSAKIIIQSAMQQCSI